MKQKIVFAITIVFLFQAIFAEERPEFVASTRDTRFAEIRVTERVLEAHAPWKTDGAREVTRTGFFINDSSVIAGGIRPDLILSLTVRLNEDTRPIPASVTFFDTELGLALISLHTDSTGSASYFNPRRRKTPATALSVATRHDTFARDRALRALGTLPAGGADSVFQNQPASFEQYGSTLAPGGSVMIPTMLFSSYAPGIETGDLLVQGRSLKGIVLFFDPERKYGHALPAPFVHQFRARALTAYRGGKNRLFIDQWSRGETRAPNTIVAHPGFTVAPLKNPPSRSYYGLKPDHAGAVVADVFPYGAAAGKLEPADVILAADGRAVGPDGTLGDPTLGRLPLTVALGLHGGLFASPGRTVRMTIARGGQQKGVTIALNQFSQENLRVPVYEPRPQYAVIGGLVFVELSQDYVKQTPTAPDRLKYLAENSRYLDVRARNRYVVLDRILPVSADLGYTGEQLLVQSVNNIAVRDVNHLRELVDLLGAAGDAVAFGLEGNRTMVLSPETIELKNRDVRARYGIQFLHP